MHEVHLDRKRAEGGWDLMPLRGKCAKASHLTPLHGEAREGEESPDTLRWEAREGGSHMTPLRGKAREGEDSHDAPVLEGEESPEP